jgi:hypothetical protein
MVKVRLAGARGREAAGLAGGRFRLASPAAALVLGGLALALMIADVPLAALAHQSLAATGGSLPVWISAPFAVVGLVVAWRKPGNPLGWIILATGVFLALSEDASYYAVADYRLRHGGLPLGWLAAVTAAAADGVGVRRASRRVDRRCGDYHCGRDHRPSHSGGSQREPASP